jgi:arginine:ornithine antiporter/lysine permease
MVLLLATTSILIPYLLSSLYAFKVWKEDKLSAKDLIVAVIAIIYSVYVILAVGLVYLAASFILYAIGMYAFARAKKEQNRPLTNGEKVGMTLVIIVGVLMLILMVTGVIAL